MDLSLLGLWITLWALRSILFDLTQTSSGHTITMPSKGCFLFLRGSGIGESRSVLVSGLHVGALRDGGRSGHPATIGVDERGNELPVGFGVTTVIWVAGDGGDLMQHIRLITMKWLMHHVL